MPIDLLNQLDRGMRSQIATEHNPEADLTAVVSAIDHVVDAASGFFGIRLELPNPDNAIRAGLECKVQFLPKAAPAP